jgi:hypothetical protein
MAPADKEIGAAATGTGGLRTARPTIAKMGSPADLINTGRRVSFAHVAGWPSSCWLSTVQFSRSTPTGGEPTDHANDPQLATTPGPRGRFAQARQPAGPARSVGGRVSSARLGTWRGHGVGPVSRQGEEAATAM